MASARTTSSCLLRIYNVPSAVLSPGHPLSLTMLLSPLWKAELGGTSGHGLGGAGQGGCKPKWPDPNPLYHADGFWFAPGSLSPNAKCTNKC